MYLVSLGRESPASQVGAPLVPLGDLCLSTQEARIDTGSKVQIGEQLAQRPSTKQAVESKGERLGTSSLHVKSK